MKEFIYPYQKKFFSWYKKNKNIARGGGALTLILLLTSCAGGGVTLQSTDGSKIKFKKENVSCRVTEYTNTYMREPHEYSGGETTWCTANGVQTDLTGNQFPFSQERECKRTTALVNAPYTVYPVKEDLRAFACAAASEFGLF